MTGDVWEQARSRIGAADLHGKMMSEDEAASMIRPNMIIACSGFTPCGYPKAIPKALVRRSQEAGEHISSIALWTGASVGDELDGALSRAGLLSRRMPYQSNPYTREAINSGAIDYVDVHLSHVAQQIRYGFWGKPDIAIIEAAAITDEGYLIPTTSVGNSPTFAKVADTVLVELNVKQPIDLYGLHDIYVPEDPPFRKTIPIYHPKDRIGTPWIKVEKKKIAAIVPTEIPDESKRLINNNEIIKKVSENLLNFIDSEIEAGRIPRALLPIQAGVGSIANAVLEGFSYSTYAGLLFYTEVIQDSMVRLIEQGKAEFASGCSLTLSQDLSKSCLRDLSYWKKHLVLRPQEITNNPEVIRRLGVISINAALEVDIYGNVNSTHVFGSNIMNGIGGSGDFARNAYLSIFVMPSTAKEGNVSTIVPMVSHVDHTEHDVHVIVTDVGVADLRGLSPRERAAMIINRCAHPSYRSLLHDYYCRALHTSGGHTPHLLKEVFSWYLRLTGRDVQ
ncbi:MAG TPA: succinate CoA transferase [Clostridia bacterium]|nr:succinate CoA transferase [Clostridia bacterium]